MSETAGFKKHHTPDVIDDDEEDFDEVLPSQDDNKYKTSWSKSNRHGTGHGLGTYDKEYHARMRSGRTPSSMYHSLEGTPDSDVSEMFDDDSKDVPSFDELPSVLFLTGDIDMKTLQKSYHKAQQNLLLKRIQEENMSKQSPHGSDRAAPVEKQIKQNKNKNLKVNVTRSETERNDDKQFKTQSKKPEHIKPLHNDEWTEAERNGDKQFKTQSKKPERIKPLHNDKWTETERNDDKQFKTQSQMPERTKPLHNNEWTEAERNDDKQFKTQSKKPEHIKPLHNDEWTEEETECQNDLVRRKRLENLTALRKKYEANRQTEQHSPFKSKSESISEDNRETVMREETKLNDKEKLTSQLWSANNTEMPDRTVLREKHRTTFSTETTTEERKLEQETKNKEIQDLGRESKMKGREVKTKVDIHVETGTNPPPKYRELESAVLEDKRKERELPEKPPGILHEGSDSDTDDIPYAMKILHSKQAHQIPSRVTGNKIKPLTKKSKKEVHEEIVEDMAKIYDLDDNMDPCFTDDQFDENFDDYKDIPVKSIQQSSQQKLKKSKNAAGPIIAKEQKKSTPVHGQQNLQPQAQHVHQNITSKTTPAQVSKGPVKNKNQTVNKNSDVKKQADEKKNQTVNKYSDVKKQADEKKDIAFPQIRKPDKKPVMKSKVLKLHLDNVDERRAKAFQIIKQGPYPRGVKCTSCGRPDCNSTNIKKMKEMAKASKQYGFDMSDVAPDGNCMFAAVVDQMDFYGIRLYESKSLREAAVTWLIDNPNSEDGTPFASFLEEDWTTYLQRMLGEGQWGDHIVLRAIVQVIGHTVKVMSVDKGEGHWTILEPSVMDKDKPELTLGHVGEFHYVSLQPSDHTKDEGADIVTGDDAKAADVVEDVTSIPLEGTESIAMFQEGHIDQASGLPVIHLSYLLKRIIPNSYIDSTAVQTSQYEQQTSPGDKDRKYELVLIGELGNKTCMKIHLEHEQPNAVKYLGHDNSTCYVSKAEASSHPDAYIMDESSVHPGFAKLIMSRDLNYIVFAPSKDLRKVQKEENAANTNDYVIKVGTLFETCEVVISCRCVSWPGSAQSWKTRTRHENWPPQEIVNNIVTSGCVLKPFPHPHSLNPDIEWEIGFELAEKTLFREAVTPGQQHCFILLKVLLMQTGELTGPLSLNYLRTVFLYACERIPTDFWLSNPGACVLYILEELLRKFKGKQLPNYFVPTNNMIDHFTDKEIQEAVDKVASVRNQPQIVVLQFHETYHLLAQGLKVYQMIQDDIPKFLQHQSVKLTTLETFVPASIEIAREYLKAGYYASGFDKLSQIHVERLAVSTCDDTLPYHLFLQDAVNGLDHNTLVWFSACADLHLKGQLPRPLVQEFCGDRELVNISDIIPAETAGEFANTLVPITFSYNVFMFCNELASFVRGVGKADTVKSVLYHAHQQYKNYLENIGDLKQGFEKDQEFPMMEVYSGLFTVVYLDRRQTEGMKEFYPCMEKLVTRLSSKYACQWLKSIYALLQEIERLEIIDAKSIALAHLEDKQGYTYFSRCCPWPHHRLMHP